MKLIAAFAALLIAGAGLAVPARGADTFVFDNAHLLSASAVANLNAKIGDFQTQTGKEVVVDTVPSLGGQSAQAVAERDFAEHQVNGVMIFVAKAEKQIGVIPDHTSQRFFPAGATTAIRNAMRAGFNSGDFDGGVTNGVDLTLAQYRSHESSLHRTSYAPYATRTTASTGGFSMSFIWLILIVIAAFLVIRAIFRAMSGPRMYPPGGPGYGGGTGYGGPGPGYGYGGGYGGGGGFWSGLLGGLGGAWLGNELFNRGGGFGSGDVGQAGFVDPGTQDAGGWQSDPGQADMGNASFGSFGDSGGGGFDGGAGGGDWGGGDSGGGW